MAGRIPELDVDSAPPAAAPPPASLIEISRVLEETARILKRHAEAFNRPVPPPAGVSEFRVTAAVVRAIVRVRQLRADYFPAAAGDPAWTMMLELYAARLEGRRLSQSQLTAAARIPHSSAVRLVRGLVAEGRVAARRDPADGRLVMLGLTDDAAGRMEAYLAVALATVPYLA